MALFHFFFNDTATTEIYTLSLHDALPICTSSTTRPLAHTPGNTGTRPARSASRFLAAPSGESLGACADRHPIGGSRRRSEEHTSELQSRQYLVCRLLLEKKKTQNNDIAWI